MRRRRAILLGFLCLCLSCTSGGGERLPGQIYLLRSESTSGALEVSQFDWLNVPSTHERFAVYVQDLADAQARSSTSDIARHEALARVVADDRALKLQLRNRTVIADEKLAEH